MSTRISSLSMRTTVPSTTSPCLKLRMSPVCSLSSSSIVVGSGPVTSAGRGLLGSSSAAGASASIRRRRAPAAEAASAAGASSGGGASSSAAVPRRRQLRLGGRAPRRRRFGDARGGHLGPSAAGALRGLGRGGLRGRRPRRRVRPRRRRLGYGRRPRLVGTASAVFVRCGAARRPDVSGGSGRRARRRRRPPRRSARAPGWSPGRLPPAPAPSRPACLRSSVLVISWSWMSPEITQRPEQRPGRGPKRSR